VVQELFDRYVFLYIMGGLCAFGVIIKLFLLIAYSRMIKASDSMSNTKKRWMKQMKLKFETCYQLKIGVNNVDVFVDKYVNRRKFCGILLSTWERISGQTISLCLLTGSISGVLGILYDCGWKQTLFTFFTGLWTSLIVIIVDNIVNIKDHRTLLHLNLNDYFENYLKVRLEREHFYPEQLTKYNQEYFTEANPSVHTACSTEEAKNDSKVKKAASLRVESAQLEKVPLERIAVQNGQRRYEPMQEVDFKTEDSETRNFKDAAYGNGRKAAQIDKRRRKEEKERQQEELRMKEAMDRQRKKDDKVLAKENAKKDKLNRKEEKRIIKQEKLEQKEAAKLEKIQARKQEEQAKLDEKRARTEGKHASRDTISDPKVLEKKLRLRQEMELERLKRAEENERYSQMRKGKEPESETQEKEAESVSVSSFAPAHTADTAASVEKENMPVSKEEKQSVSKNASNEKEKAAEDKLIEEVLKEFLA